MPIYHRFLLSRHFAFVVPSVRFVSDAHVIAQCLERLRKSKDGLPGGEFEEAVTAARVAREIVMVWTFRSSQSTAVSIIKERGAATLLLIDHISLMEREAFKTRRIISALEVGNNARDCVY